MRSSCSRALMGLFFLGFADVDEVFECLGGAARDASGEDGTFESLPNPGRTFLQSSQSLSNASWLSWSISSSSSPSVFSYKHVSIARYSIWEAVLTFWPVSRLMMSMARSSCAPSRSLMAEAIESLSAAVRVFLEADFLGP